MRARLVVAVMLAMPLVSSCAPGSGSSSELSSKIQADGGPAALDADPESRPASPLAEPEPAAQPGPAPSGPVTLSQANLYKGMSRADFGSDLATVVDSGADFITLNETYRRSLEALLPPGYGVHRAQAPRDARETPVLWRTDRWRPVDSGTLLMHDRRVRWGTRYANWITVRERSTGALVSVISGHASPGGGRRQGLLRAFVRRLDILTARLAERGPVLIGADLNASYQETPFLQVAFSRSRATPTFDALGEPGGGWATGDGGRTIDYILATEDLRATAHTTAPLAHSDHRLLTATFEVTPPSNGYDVSS